MNDARPAWRTRERALGHPRVVMVVRLFDPWVGGTERQARTLALGLAARGVDVRIVTGRWFRGTPRHETIQGVPVLRNHTLWEFFGVRGLRRLGGYLYMATLYAHLWRTRATYDVIHVHGMNYHSAVAVHAGRRLGKPTITKVANSGDASDINKMREDRQLQGARHLLETALQSSRFVALNTTVREELRHVGVPDSRIVAIPNGVVVDGVPDRSDHSRSGPVHAVFVGRLHPQKGLLTLLEAAARIEARTPGQLRVSLLGDGPQRAVLEAAIEDLAIGHVVRLAGEVDDVGPTLRDADVFVLPSAVEGLSNALLEAMTHQLPVVASAIPGNTDVIEDGRNGLLFDHGDASALAGCLERLLRDPDLRARLGARARRDIDEQYALDRVVDRYIALYEQLTAEDHTA